MAPPVTSTATGVVLWARRTAARHRHECLLTGPERVRAARYLRQVDRDRFVVGNALLRQTVAECTGQPVSAVRVDRSCPDCSDPHGKPVIRDAEIHVSVSHAGDWVGVAVTDAGPVGLDVEQTTGSAEIDDLMSFALVPAEAAELRALAADARRPAFLRYWTRKESVLKATGSGLRTPMRAVTVSTPGAPPRLLSATPPELAEVARLYDVDPDAGHPAAMTVLSSRRVQVTVSDGHALLG